MEEAWPEIVWNALWKTLKPEAAVVEEIVSLGDSMGLGVDECNINELIEELKELQRQ